MQKEQKSVNPIKHLMRPVFSMGMSIDIIHGQMEKFIMTDWFDKDNMLVEQTPVNYSDEEMIFKMMNKLFFEHRAGFKALVRFAIARMHCECCDVPIKDQIFELCRTDKALSVWLDECLTEDEFYD